MVTHVLPTSDVWGFVLCVAFFVPPCRRSVFISAKRVHFHARLCAHQRAWCMPNRCGDGTVCPPPGHPQQHGAYFSEASTGGPWSASTYVQTSPFPPFYKPLASELGHADWIAVKARALHSILSSTWVALFLARGHNESRAAEACAKTLAFDAFLMRQPANCVVCS
jgi:hypothetical protein